MGEQQESARAAEKAEAELPLLPNGLRLRVLVYYAPFASTS